LFDYLCEKINYLEALKNRMILCTNRIHYKVKQVRIVAMNTAFWNVTPYSMVDGYQCFGGGTFPRNVGNYLPGYAVSYRTRRPRDNRISETE
jgi:hypothetical protein